MANYFRQKLTKPIFMPDATYGIVNSVSYSDLKKVGTEAIVTNTLHVSMNADDKHVNDLGGFKSFTGWDGGVITDSGGFQAYSLVKRGLGKMFDDRVEFINPRNGSKHILTPKSSIDIQLNLRTDVVIVLDDCLHPSSSRERVEQSVEKTTIWAKECKEYFTKRFKEIQDKDPEYDPLIFCVIQGGQELDLRERSFNELNEIGFDGYGFGGWPTSDDNIFLDEIVEFNAKLANKTGKYNYAMGIGYPKDIIKCIKWGYNLFDCVVPTRNARHGLLYSINKETKEVEELKITRSEYRDDKTPLNEDSEIEELRNTTRAYLNYLFRIKDTNSLRIATLLNLESYNRLLKT